jgi:hypothetical protein
MDLEKLYVRLQLLWYGHKMKIAIFNSENYVENIIEVNPEELPEMLNEVQWLDISEDDISVGQEYFPGLQKFKPFQTRLNFIFDENKWEWVHPVAPPSDATWIPEIDGEETEEHKALAVKKIYYWLDEYQAWAMFPCTCEPKPEGDFYWNPIQKEWQAPDSEKPEGDFWWDTLKKVWFERMPAPTPPTE